MQIPDKDFGFESGATIAGISSKPMGPATSRTKVTGGQVAVR
ncbi:hypothetical protein [Candidatus Cryosericum terrychapinii]|nr:hypothetical protein [Candidatus Cryosericum terrychapinii]